MQTRKLRGDKRTYYVGPTIPQLGGGVRELLYLSRRKASEKCRAIQRNPALIECAGPDAVLDRAPEPDPAFDW